MRARARLSRRGCRSPVVLRGGRVHRGMQPLLRDPRAGGLLGAVAAKCGVGACPRGRGAKGLSGSQRGLGTICRAEPRARQDGEGSPRSAELCAGRGGSAGAHRALALRWLCGVPRPGARALLRRCPAGGSPWEELFKPSFPSPQPPRSAPPTRLGSCWCRQSHGEGSGGRSVLPPWPGWVCKAVPSAGAHARTHTAPRLGPPASPWSWG